MKHRIPTVLFLILICIYTASSQTAAVISGNANLRGTPRQSGRVVTLLPNGTEVEILRQQDAWFLVQSPDFVGWIHGNTIQITERVQSPVIEKNYSAPAPLKTEVSEVTIVERATPIETEQRPVLTQSINVTQTPVVAHTATGRCEDGSLTYATDRQGACSGHGGLAYWYADPTHTAPQPSTGGPIQVKGYFRKDGTYVRPHTRRRPRP